MQLINGVILVDGIRRILKALKMRPDLKVNECYMVLYLVSYLIYTCSIIVSAEELRT